MGTLRLATRGSPLALRQTELVSELLRRPHPGLDGRAASSCARGATRTPTSPARPDRRPGRVRHRGGGGGGRRSGRRRRALGQGHALGDAGGPRPGRGAAARRRPRRPRRLHAGRPAGGRPGRHRLGPAPGPAGRICARTSSSPTCGGTWPGGWRWPRRESVSAVVVAVAAMDRLGWREQADATSSTRSTCCPRRGRAPSPCSAGPTTTARGALLAAIDHEPSQRALRAERAVLAGLGGSCTVPVGRLRRAGP